MKPIVEERLNKQNNSVEINEFKDLIILFQPQRLIYGTNTLRNDVNISSLSAIIQY